MKQDLYSKRVQSLIKESTGLCVGLDPSTELLQSWGLSDNLEGLKAFCDRMLEVCIESKVAFAKPQSAFYERFGWEGMYVLTEMNKKLRSAGIFTILDCKRGDISSTAIAYADAYLSESDYSKYDAITVNPFLGYESHQPYIDIIKKQSVGIFIVMRSSNPDSHYIQQARIDNDLPISTWLARKIFNDNLAIFGKSNLGAIGAVVGATIDSLGGLLDDMSTSFFLCPGIGAQGATVELVKKTFSQYIDQCIFPVSRGISMNTPSKKALIANVVELKTMLKSK